MKSNFKGLEMQKWNKPMDKVQKVGEKNGFICLVIMFTPAVTAIEMSKMALFFFFFFFYLALLVIAMVYWVLRYH